MALLGFFVPLDASHSLQVGWEPYHKTSLWGDQFRPCGNFPLNHTPHSPFSSKKLLEKSSRFFGVEHEEGSSSKGIYVLLSFLWQPPVESLVEFPILHAGGWEICHESLIALPCLGVSLIHKLLVAHPWIHLVTLLANLSEEESQKSYRDKSRCEPREQVVNCRWLGFNKTFPYDLHKQPHGSR
jgi:hypothetical protein